MSKSFAKNLVITGSPGTGKTTLVREVLLPYKEKAAGFVTEEIREGGVRLGFKLQDLEGRGGVLASKTLAGPPKLNKYGIDLAVLETIGVAAVRGGLENHRIVVLDEIGSMELFSESFRTTVLEALTGPLPVLATIRLGSQPFTDSIKTMTNTELLTLTKANFADTRVRVREWLEWSSTRLDGRMA